PGDHLVVAWAGAPPGEHAVGPGRLVALRVDRALDLTRLEASAVESARGVVPGVEYVAWVAKRPNDLVLIHDLRTFLSRAEATWVDAALAAGTSPEEAAEKGVGSRYAQHPPGRSGNDSRPLFQQPPEEEG